MDWLVAHPVSHDNLLCRGDLLSLDEKRQTLPLVELEKALPLLTFRLRETDHLCVEGCYEVFESGRRFCLPHLPLTAEPILETCRGDTRVVAWNEGVIVQL